MPAQQNEAWRAPGVCFAAGGEAARRAEPGAGRASRSGKRAPRLSGSIPVAAAIFGFPA
jgi:hypothetical protein